MIEGRRGDDKKRGEEMSERNIRESEKIGKDKRGKKRQRQEQREEE